LFSARVKLVWLGTYLFLAAAELIAVGQMPAPEYCLYYAVKVTAFFALGFLIPLAFQTLNGLAVATLSAFAAAGSIEAIQTMMHNGHSFHWHELAGKIALITLGFAFALERRYERRMSVGPFAVQLAIES
jgi:hypothetical protein